MNFYFQIFLPHFEPWQRIKFCSLFWLVHKAIDISNKAEFVDSFMVDKTFKTRQMLPNRDAKIPDIISF